MLSVLDAGAAGAGVFAGGLCRTGEGVGAVDWGCAGVDDVDEVDCDWAGFAFAGSVEDVCAGGWGCVCG
jgi:hypothetical protein